ncbi:MAG: cyclase family protein [Pseudomonadota bacterium]
MPIFDVSQTLDELTPVFPGDPPFSISAVVSRENHDEFNLSLLSMTTHTGTHVDAPLHYLDGGGTIDSIPADILVGEGIVLDVKDADIITRAILEKSPWKKETRIFLKTKRRGEPQGKKLNKKYPYISDSGAQLLIERGVKLVGIDCMSVDRIDDQYAPVHKLLLSSGIIIVEGLDLDDAPIGTCRIYCLPLKIRGGDGAPARVFIETF